MYDPDPTLVPLSDLSRPEGQGLLRDIGRMLRTAGICKAGTWPHVIAHARVPIVKFTDRSTGIDCDISVASDGVFKSQAAGRILAKDPRAVALVRLTKLWAKDKGKPALSAALPGGLPSRPPDDPDPPPPPRHQ